MIALMNLIGVGAIWCGCKYLNDMQMRFGAIRCAFLVAVWCVDLSQFGALFRGNLVHKLEMIWCAD